jgi:hypothetical protein
MVQLQKPRSTEQSGSSAVRLMGFSKEHQWMYTMGLHTQAVSKLWLVERPSPVSEVIVATDCLEVVQGLQGKYYGQFSHILQEIGVSARGRAGISFFHERRASNEEAHKLVRLGTTLDVGRHVWFTFPPERINLPVSFLNNE